MKKLLSFVFAMFMIAPAFAESFPNDELMLENKTYDNAAIYDNTGVYSGDVDADPEFDWTQITVNAGQYLPQSATSTAQCTAGNYCTGLQNTVHYDDTQDQGLTSCATLGDGSFINSAVGASLDTQCYKNCSTTDIANSTKVSGNDYYGNGTDTCTATACDGGYALSSGSCNANTLTITWNGVSSETVTNANAGTCTYGGAIRTPPAPPHIPGKTFVGWRVKLPYTKLEYIESTGTQYINTGVQSSGIGLTVKTRVSAIDLEAEYAICGRQASGGFELYFANNNMPRIGIFNAFDTDGQGNRTVNIFNNISANTIYNITASVTSTNMTLDVDGDTATSDRTPIPGSVHFIDLFRHAAHMYAKIKMYYFKLYNNGVLVRDMIPVKDSNGVVCMYDRVGKQFYYNSGTADFIAGPEI